MSSPATPGMQLGRYRLIEQVGAGGMGVVFRARDEKLERDVAIKIIKPGLLDADARDRFRREALILSKLSHPGIQVIHDFDHEGDIDFLVVEFIQGQSLDELVATGPLPIEKVISLGRQLAAALASAHGQGILHRDLKPSNIRVTPDGHLKVLDFGLAKFYLASPEAETEMLQTRGVVGTGPYLAPELLKGASATVASDIYAAGICLYEMATGERPYKGTLGEMIPQVMNASARPPSKANPSVSRELESVIVKSMNRDPQERYGSARELHSDLEALGTRSRRVEAYSVVGLHRYWIAAAAALVVALMSGGWWYSKRNSFATPQKIQSMAVLPLENLSKDSAQEYIAAGMTDQLTSELASLRSLKVISKTSATNYANTKLASPEIAKKLGVDALLEGSVLRNGDEIRITLELINGATDEHLWSQVYERNTKDLFALQREVAQAVARQIHLKVTGGQEKQIATAGTTNPEAYDLYLRAQYKSRTALASKEDAQAQLEMAEQATKLDPQFAQAYLTVAHACFAFMFGHRGGQEYDEKASIAIDKALALNPRLPEAYVRRGQLYYNAARGFDSAAAIENYRKALAIDPNYAEAHHQLGSELTHSGFNDRAVAEFKKALEFDPENSGAKFRMGRALMQGNRFDESVQTYLRYGIADIEEMASYGYLGKFDEALRVGDLLKNPRVKNGTKDREVPAALGLIYAMQGKKPQALAEIKKVNANEFGPHFHHQALLIASAYAEMGAPHEAVGYLRFCVEHGMPAYTVFNENPSLRKLAGNAEYEQFMAELKPRWEQVRAVVEKEK